jgi:hypothetical protein
MDLRSTTPLAEMNLVNVSPSQGTLGLADPRRLRPGDRSQSVLWQRLQTTNPAWHMPSAMRTVDAGAVALLGAWIDADPTRDFDLDGVPDDSDVCSWVMNPMQTDQDRDRVGDNCDNCRFVENLDQADTDRDWSGDTCDSVCVDGMLTRITSVQPPAQGAGLLVEILGTGFSPNARVEIGGLTASVVRAGAHLLATVPALPVASVQRVVVVNPEGCRSQEVVKLTINAAPPACGLLGFELLVAPLGLAAWRAHGRRHGARGWR